MKGEDAFHDYYSKVYGRRWPELFASLMRDPVKLALSNPFHAGDPDLEASYLLDGASAECTKVLPLNPGESWLDLCAAPGGKSLSLIFRLRELGEVTLNDSSSARVRRLKAVMHDYLPAEVMARIRFACKDGQRWGLFEKEVYDAVLVDAPCSGERFLLRSPGELAGWSARRSKGLSVRQQALLCAALDAVKPGGHILYSTCSISPIENDELVGRFLKKRSGRVELLTVSLPGAEATERGQIFLPDISGSGPLYLALMRKV